MVATVKLGSHLENISDQAVEIARRIRALIQEKALEKDDGLTSIFEQVDRFISESLGDFRCTVRLLCEPCYSGVESGANFLSDREHHGGHHLRRGAERYPVRENKLTADNEQ